MRKEILVNPDLHKKLNMLKVMKEKRSFNDVVELLYEYYEEREMTEKEK